MYRYTPFLQSLCLLLALLFMPAALHAAKADPARGETAVEQQCERIGHKLGSVSVADCVERKLTDTGARTVSHQAILLKEYPPLARRDPIGRVLLIGGTHGDEYAAVSIVFKWMQKLDRYHSGMFHWHVVPLLNPDGLLLHRPSLRLNDHGVDLNRNMPSPDWFRESAAYWKSRNYDPRRYPGTAPLSEPETQWLADEIRTFKPHAIVSVHAPYGVLDFDGPPVGPSDIGYLHLKLIGVYPGSLGNYAGIQHDIPVITVELPYAGIMPTQAQISHMWIDLVHWLRLNIPKERTLAAYKRFDEINAELDASSLPAKGDGNAPAEREDSGGKRAPAIASERPAAPPSSAVHINNSKVMN